LTELTDLEVHVSASPVESAQVKPTKHSWRFTWMDLWLFVLMIIWGSNIAILKTALEVLPPYVLNGVRFSAATVVLALIFKANGIRLTLPRRD
jgi:drug/metabolite transporter (DMT)-like permease